MKTHMIDGRRLIAEVAARNGIRVEPDDPAFALVTLNQLVLEDFVTRMDERIRLGIAEFMDAVHKTEGVRARSWGPRCGNRRRRSGRSCSGMWKLRGLALARSS